MAVQAIKAAIVQAAGAAPAPLAGQHLQASGSKGGGSSFPTWAVVVIVLLALALISIGAGELSLFYVTLLSPGLCCFARSSSMTLLLHATSAVPPHLPACTCASVTQ